MQSKVWKWYARHKNAINAIMEMSCDLIPGGRVLVGTLRLANNWIADKREEKQEQQIQEVERWLTDIKPVVSDIVEEIEELQSFQKANTQEEILKAIEESEIRLEVKQILPQISQSISRSMSYLAESQILNNRYLLEKKIGKGGQGEVYLAKHIVADIPVAVKLLPIELTDDTMAISRLRKEYNRLVQRLTHENIVQYRDLDQDHRSGRFFIVMDYVHGYNLRNILIDQHERSMSLSRIIEILQPVASALDFAHENKIVHCDLKPENILIRQDNKVLLTDFGLAHEIQSSLSRRPGVTGNICGTLPYMSPEQYLGRPLDGACDIWALGVILYEMLAGYHPFQGTHFDHYMRLICDVDPEPIAFLGQNQWEILRQMLDKNRKKRPFPAKKVLLEIAKVEFTESKIALMPEIEIVKSEELEEKAIIALEPTADTKNEDGLLLTRKKLLSANQLDKEDMLITKAFAAQDEKQIEVESPEQQQISLSIPGFIFLRTREYICGPFSHSIEEYLHERTQMEFALLQGGEFYMGASSSEQSRNSDEAWHKVSLSPFLIGKNLCTQGQWHKIVGRNPSYFQGENRPVENVSWNHCQAFCHETGLRLPTEAEWEYACRSGSEDSYCFGKDASLLGEYAWYVENSQGMTQNIAKKKPNTFGLYDMHGNVWEWCADFCNWDLKKGVLTDSYRDALHNPLSLQGSHRIFRGGSWDSASSYCRCAFRGSFLPEKSDYSLGVRFALNLES